MVNYIGDQDDDVMMTLINLDNKLSIMFLSCGVWWNIQ